MGRPTAHVRSQASGRSADARARHVNSGIVLFASQPTLPKFGASLGSGLDGEEHLPGSWKKLARAVEEFHTYIQANAPFIPNYGERW